MADITPPPIITTVEEVQEEPPKEEVKHEPTEYIVQKGDNLHKIAKRFNTTWQRLFYKNKDVKHPDQLVVGDTLAIPEASEELKKRDYVIKQPEPVKKAPVASRGVVSGNTYDWGNCTWYAKNYRPDLPNNLGNANNWYYRAQSQGLPTGTTPQVGAVATTTAGYWGHVAIVERVDGNRIYVSEMNVQGLGVTSYAWYPASNFLYIY